MDQEGEEMSGLNHRYQKYLDKFFKESSKRTRIVVSLSVIALLLFLSAAALLPFKDKIFNLLYPKPKSQAVEQAGPPRGVEGDLWADIEIGQRDFGEINPGEITPYRPFNPGGVIVDKSVSPGRAYMWDSSNNRILGFDLAKCYAQTSQPCSADVVLGQPSGYDYGACNGDSAFQNYPHRAKATEKTLCGVWEGTFTVLEDKSFSGMATDSQGNLYVPDTRNNRILKYISPFTTDTVADEVWGQDNFTGNECNKTGSILNGIFPLPTASSLCYISNGADVIGIAFDKDDNLWVADGGNSRVLRFLKDPSSKIISKTANLVLGQPDFTSMAQGFALNQMKGPTSLDFDSSGKLYVADARNNRILVFEPPFTLGMSAAKTLGPQLSEPDPKGLKIDPSGRGVWVFDIAGNRFRLFGFDASSSAEPIKQFFYAQRHGGSFDFDALGNLLISYDGGGQDIMRYQLYPDGKYYVTKRLLQPQFYDPGALLGLWPPSTSTPSPTSTPPSLNASRVFVTSTLYDGNLGGLSGADSKCQARANAANLGGTWKAWLSDNQTSAASRLIHYNGPYQLLNGTTIANSWDDLADGTLRAPIEVTELNTYKWYQVWTNTNRDGSITQDKDSTSCENWSTISAYGGMGYSRHSSDFWTQYPLIVPCSRGQLLYCFEQVVNPTPTPTPTPSPVRRLNNTAWAGMAVAGDQLVVTDLRLLFWNGLDSLTNGKPADGHLGTNSFSEFPARGYNQVKSDADQRVWVSNGSVEVYQAPLETGEKPIKTINKVPVLGGGEITLEASGLVPTAHGEFLWISESHKHRVYRIRDPLSDNPVVDIILGQKALTTGDTGYQCNRGGALTLDTLCAPGAISIDKKGNLYVSDHSIETNGNLRMLMFSADMFPATPANVIYAPAATKEFPRRMSTPSISDYGEHMTFEPAFDSQNHMVVGFNPYSQIRFVKYYNDPTKLNPANPSDPEYARPDGQLNDYVGWPISVAFDSKDNLYIFDANRTRVLIYKKPVFPNPFTNLSASLPLEGPATFNFTYSVGSGPFKINVSTIADMSWDVYWKFAEGTSSPITISNPSVRWDKYSCGRILYWQVTDATGTKSPIQSTVVSCPTATSVPAGNVVFVSSATYNGNLGGLAGADAKCQERATAANLQGTYKAWISDSTGSPSTRFNKSTAPYKLVDGTVIANNWDDLNVLVRHSINKTESNTIKEGVVWSNTNRFGEVAQAVSCQNWSSATPSTVPNEQGLLGDSSSSYLSSWTITSPQSCDKQASLYCFQQGQTSTPSPTASLPTTVPTPSPTPSPTPTPTPASKFSNVSASMPLTGATFNFTYAGISSIYYINASTRHDMSSDIYWAFASGASSPVTLSNPSAKWDKYSCGRTLYWQVVSSSNDKSPIQSTQVVCPSPTPTP